ncbi:MAG: sporulation integral membrane protein YlbJ [Clostridiales bacterium]|nr:sporulation integral membrane protein YlbJ [Clostridiales bacterium]
MVIRPEMAFAGAERGLKIWWYVVFPALLPFFIGSYLLVGLGVVAFLGVLMRPLMRPLFGIPGQGAFVVAMGFNSGYPVGAVLAAELRKKNQITPTEATRLTAFSNTSDPLFMGGAVAVGMLNQPLLVGTIMSAHYLGAFFMGILMKLFYRRGQDETPEPKGNGPNLLREAWEALLETRRQDGRSLGALLGDSVRRSVDTLLLIGGFIILFSVLVDMAKTFGILAFFAALLSPLGLSPQLAEGIFAGFLEISVGAQLTAHAPEPLLTRTMVASAIIAWSGLSVIAQVAAVTRDTGIQIGVYTLARLIHAFLAAGFTYLLWPPDLTALPTLGSFTAPPSPPHPPFLAALASGSLRFAAGLALLGVGSIVFLLSSLWRGNREREVS